MRIALYSLIFLGTVLLVLDLMKQVETIEVPEKPKPTERVVSPGTKAEAPPKDSTHEPTSAGHPDIAQALKLYTKAIENTPKQAKPYIDRANAYIANRQHPEALNDFNKALEFEPKNTDYILQRGAHFLRLKQEDKAIIDFTEAFKIDPAFTKALIYRGITHFQDEQFQPALDDFLLILKKDPTFVDLHISIAECYHKLANNEKAEQHLLIYRKSTKDPEGTQKAEDLEKEWAKGGKL